MDLENSKAQMKKGILEYCILSIISREEAYASDIIEEMKEARLLVVEGTLYPLLSRLKNDGLLSYNWVESKSGPPRKYYQLTEQGKLFMAELSTTWNELVDAVNHISNKTINIK
ncbi:MAG: PadR family transcriptional regulator [Bacteroidia bacterium]|nr:PadR family transcriptional regulator [Bacteroidia bacterium]MCF8428311.1 PadR family transcriptional regulator [Bacteroidia bacterium]